MINQVLDNPVQIRHNTIGQHDSRHLLSQEFTGFGHLHIVALYPFAKPRFDLTPINSHSGVGDLAKPLFGTVVKLRPTFT